MGIFNIHLPKDINIHLTIKQEQDPATIKYLQELSLLLINVNSKIEKLMSNTDTALADLAAIGASLTKIGGETTTLLQKITDLENTTTDDTPQAVLDAIAAVKEQAITVDNLVPDAPVTTPPTV